MFQRTTVVIALTALFPILAVTTPSNASSPPSVEHSVHPSATPSDGDSSLDPTGTVKKPSQDTWRQNSHDSVAEKQNPETAAPVVNGSPSRRFRHSSSQEESYKVLLTAPIGG
jgi:hypothetical protein